MKEGDLVRYIGLCINGTKSELKYGVVLGKYWDFSGTHRVDVLWWDRSIGSHYPQSLEVVNEAR